MICKRNYASPQYRHRALVKAGDEYLKWIIWRGSNVRSAFVDWALT